MSVEVLKMRLLEQNLCKNLLAGGLGILGIKLFSEYHPSNPHPMKSLWLFRCNLKEGWSFALSWRGLQAPGFRPPCVDK